MDDFLCDIHDEYGHAYFPDFNDADVRRCAQLWTLEEGSAALMKAYYGGYPPADFMAIGIDFQDHIEDWICERYEDWLSEE